MAYTTFMPNDPLTEFVNGNYSHRPSAGQLSTTKWFCRCLLAICSIVSLWIFAILVNEVRPAWKLDTAEAVVVSKSKKYRSNGILHHRGIINWTFLDQYDPEKTSFSGYDKVSLSYLSETEIGDKIRVQYTPSKRRTPDNVRLVGSTPILFILSHSILLLILFYLNRYALRALRLARRDPVAFEKMTTENMIS